MNPTLSSISTDPPPPSPVPGREHGLALLRQMMLIRRFEEKSAELYTQLKIRGFLHLYVGEEAVAVGVMSALDPDDAVIATYREHGHGLAKGIAPGAIMAEMFGKQEGCSRGRGGSMHLFDAAHRFYGGGAIVGGGLPIAVGLALADKMRGLLRISCCFFGEGAAAEGEFHESMNLAALWKLPVLFVCENNYFAMGSALSITESVTDFTRKASSYGVPAAAVDGMDVLAVETATRQAVAAIRSGTGPYFLEARTYRFRAHSMFDPELYRTKAEVEQWKQHDPINTLADKLGTAGLLQSDELEALRHSVEQEVSSAVAFAEAGTWEPVEDLARFVYSEPAP